MAQMYMIEIFVDKVTVFPSENDSSADKKLILKIKFGPKEQFIIREGAMVNNNLKDDIQHQDENTGKMKWSRVIRIGRSFLFPSYPDTMGLMLQNFPLEIEVWNDDENEVKEYIGVGLMIWDKEFFHMLRESTSSCEKTEPLTIKQTVTLYAECCCGPCGSVDLILRLSVLGQSITTEFQQPMDNPNQFIFRNDRFPSVYKCQRIEGDDPNFTIIGALYESVTLEKPMFRPERIVEVCTDLDSCAIGSSKGPKAVCSKGADEMAKLYPIKRIRMGDIAGPCGNANCTLAHKVKMYLRNSDAYKKAASETQTGMKVANATKNVCGKCVCKEDRWHRGQCPGNDIVKPKVCKPCGGVTKVGPTCDETKTNLFEPRKPEDIDKDVRYVLSVPNFPTHYNHDHVFGPNDYIVQCSRCEITDQDINDYSKKLDFSYCEYTSSFPSASDIMIFSAPPIVSTGLPTSGNPSSRYHKMNDDLVTPVYTASKIDTNVDASYSKTTNQKDKYNVFNFTAEQTDKDCQCQPMKLPPPCRSLDCECIEHTYNKLTRKSHKPYCPCYKHKEMCPVTMLNVEVNEEDEYEEAETLPYGLPPVKLGPCPVMGRPCTVPDGFARMYKTALLQPLPPSHGEAGKVCCSKEFERIKKALKEYMKYEKENDVRCLDKFNVDTERRCCDKEQNLFPLIGESCCGTHKLAIQDKFKDKK